MIRPEVESKVGRGSPSILWFGLNVTFVPDSILINRKTITRT